MKPSEKTITSNLPEEVVGAETPKLPEQQQITDLLLTVVREICALPPENHESLLSSYYPLIASAYRLVKISLKKIDQFPIKDKETQNLQRWLFHTLGSLSQVIEFIIQRINVENNPVTDQLLIAYLDEYSTEPYQWNSATMTWIGQWLLFILSPENRHGNPPFYIYVSKDTEKQFPPFLPRILEKDEWISGFGGRFLVLPGALQLTDDQKALLWNHLLVEENLYGDETINHSLREDVFEALLNQFPNNQHQIRHLDLCGGTGNFIEWLREKNPSIHSFLIDNADQAVERARSKNISAFVGSAEEPLQIQEPVDVITIVFAIQWLTPGAFTHVLSALKPGGTLLANVYPFDKERAEIYSLILQNAGFVEIVTEKIEGKTEKPQYILRAKKPTENKKAR